MRARSRDAKQLPDRRLERKRTVLQVMNIPPFTSRTVPVM